MRTVTYRHRETGEPFTVEYDENAPCVWCGLPVVAASMGGTACCPWCDLGVCRFDRSHRVDMEWDHETQKIARPSKHYEKFHADDVTRRPRDQGGE